MRIKQSNISTMGERRMRRRMLRDIARLEQSCKGKNSVDEREVNVLIVEWPEQHITVDVELKRSEEGAWPVRQELIELSPDRTRPGIEARAWQDKIVRAIERELYGASRKGSKKRR